MMKFVKNGYNVGLEIFTRNGGSQEWGGGGAGWGWWCWKFLISLHSWQRGADTIILWRPPSPYIAYPPFLSPLPCQLQPPLPLLFLLYVSLGQDTNSKIYTSHFGCSRLTQPCNFIFTPDVIYYLQIAYLHEQFHMCSQQLPLLH